MGKLWDVLFGTGGLLGGDGTPAAARTALGVAIGTNVQAYAASASQAEIEAGTEAALRAMSPLRIKQAIAALVPTSTSVPVRQTVLSGPVDTNGISAFGGSTGSTTVTATGTLKATAAAGGDVDYIGSIVNPSWTGLSTNGAMYLYLDITSGGVVTPGSTTLAPTYRWGGADVTTNLQNTFNIQEMKMKMGNGSVANQVYRVFVGEVTVAGGVVTAITWYALMGRYRKQVTPTNYSAGTVLSANHNIGVLPDNFRAVLVCTSAVSGYAVGDIIDALHHDPTAGSGYGANVAAGRLAIQYSIAASGGIYIVPKGGGTSATASAANFDCIFTANRGW